MSEVTFVGAGPGAEDLITLRGAAALEGADLVLYAGSLVNPALLRRCRPECACLDSAGLDLEEQIRIMSEAALAGKRVVRLHTGDPCLYGAIAEQIAALAEQGVGAVIVPGVSSVFAAAAALGRELTLPGVSQSVVLTRTPGRTPMPAGETAAAFARTGATLAFFLSAGRLPELVAELTGKRPNASSPPSPTPSPAPPLPESTPAAVVCRASWEDERIVRGTLADIAQRAADAGIGRQALVLVGRALGEQGRDPASAAAADAETGEGPEAGAKPASSRLYAASFSHGYRNNLEDERFAGSCAVYAFSRQGTLQAQRLAAGLEAGGLRATVYASRPEEGVLPLRPQTETWRLHNGHIFIGAAGIAVRRIAPLLTGKTRDPAVVCCPENGAEAISLLSGHLGGANRLARRVARILGGRAVISTATDGRGATAFDEAAAREGARVVNSEAVRALNAALLDGERILFRGPAEVYERHFRDLPNVERAEGTETPARLAVLWDAPETEGTEAPAPCDTGGTRATDGGDQTVLRIASATVLGIGCRRGADPEAVRRAASAFLADHGLNPARLARLASCDIKAAEPALRDLAAAWNVPLEFHPAEALAAVDVPTPSERVMDKIGTPSVAEAAALLSAARLIGGEAGAGIESGGGGSIPEGAAALVAPKTIRDGVTLALARAGHGQGFGQARGENRPPAPSGARPGRVTVAGIGSGSPDQVTPQAADALRRCDVAAGYTPYLDMAREFIAGKPRIGNGMRGEVERCRAALETALSGREVCMVCSGDPGILAMAGLLFELRAAEARLAPVDIRVVPGITAASLAAAELGAPLQNGYCLISLSDLLTPAEEVRANLAAAGASALPVVLYNPAGRKRRALLEEALSLFTARRGPETLCALVRHAGRPEAERWIGRLADFPAERADMSSLIVIGGPKTRLVDGVLYEPRGYADKYDIGGRPRPEPAPAGSAEPPRTNEMDRSPGRGNA